MFAGKSFGKFIAEDLLPGQAQRVFLAHQRNSQELGGYVVKVVSVAESGVADVSATARRWLDGVSLQDRVAQDWHDVVAPVVERPTKAAEVVETLNSGNVWYVTRRYDGSLKDVLDGLGGNPATAEVIWQVCRAVARGALAFKQVDAPSGGHRSHGNLKPGNILFAGLPIQEGKSEIVVSDPAPVLLEGASPDPARIEEEFERRDLVEIGKVLFQLVAGRCLSGQYNWSGALGSPEGDQLRWRQVFGKATGTWRALCQELLEAETAAKPLSLADVEHRLGGMRPRVAKPILPKLIAVAAVLVVTGLASWLFTLWQLRGVIVVQVRDGNGLTADVTMRNRNSTRDVKTVPLVDGAAEFQVKSGNTYEISVVPNGAFRRIPSPPIQLQPVSPRSRKTNEFSIGFTTLNVAARNVAGQPVAAGLSLGGETNILSLPTTLYLPPTNRLYQLNVDPAEASGVYPTNLAVTLDRPGIVLTTNVVLQTVVPGMASISFRADARLPLTYRYGTNSLELGRDAFRVPRSFRQGDSITVTVQPPYPWPAFTTNWVVPAVNSGEFPRNFLTTNTLVQLNWTAATDPTRTEVWVGRGGDAPQPIGSVLLSQASIFPPNTDDYRFVFKRTGYRSATNDSVHVTAGATNLVTVPPLDAIYGFVELAANLPGFKVYTNGVLLGAASGSNLTVNLPPFVRHELTLVYSNDFGLLPDRRLTARVEPGETNRQSTAFDFVRIEIAPMPTNAAIVRLTSAGEALPVRARHFFQAPGVTNTYRVELDHYEPTEVALGFPTAGIPLQPTPVVLKPRKYPVYFEVSPPDAILYEPRAGTGYSRGTNFLEFGRYTIVANHLMLGSITNSFGIDPSVTQTQRWDLPSGTVSIATGQEGLGVKIYPDDPTLAKVYDEQNGNDWLRIGQPAPWKTPVINASLPPGGYRVVFSDGGESATNHFQVALNQLTNISLPNVVFLPSSYKNSLGMEFLKVPGESAYISEAPVSRLNFNKILDPNGQYPIIRGERAAVTDELPDNTGNLGTLPAASLTNMLEFCRILTEQEPSLFRDQLRDVGWQYELPGIKDWRAGAQATGFEIPTIQDPNDGSTVNLRELVLNGNDYVESEKDPAKRLYPVRGASLRNGRVDLGFRVVVRRKPAGR